jgi:hypothetical protein
MGMQKWESPDGEDRKSNSKVCSCCLKMYVDFMLCISFKRCRVYLFQHASCNSINNIIMRYKKGLQMVIVCFPVFVSLGVGGALHM